MQAEGVTELTPKGFIDWCRNGSGYERKHLYDDKKLNEAVQVRCVLYYDGTPIATTRFFRPVYGVPCMCVCV